MDWLPVIRVTIAFAVLCLASYSDWRTRMASDMYWIAMGLIGLALLVWQIFDSGNDPLYLLPLAPFSGVKQEKPLTIGRSHGRQGERRIDDAVLFDQPPGTEQNDLVLGHTPR